MVEVLAVVGATHMWHMALLLLPPQQLLEQEDDKNDSHNDNKQQAPSIPSIPPLQSIHHIAPTYVDIGTAGMLKRCRQQSFRNSSKVFNRSNQTCKTVYFESCSLTFHSWPWALHPNPCGSYRPRPSTFPCQIKYCLSRRRNWIATCFAPKTALPAKIVKSLCGPRRILTIQSFVNTFIGPCGEVYHHCLPNKNTREPAPCRVATPSLAHATLPRRGAQTI